VTDFTPMPKVPSNASHVINTIFTAAEVLIRIHTSPLLVPGVSKGRSSGQNTTIKSGMVTLSGTTKLEPIRCNVYYSIGATYTSVIEHLLYGKIIMSDALRNNYMHPMRDLSEYEDWVTDKIKNQYPTTLIGKDVQLFMERIKDPLTYDNKYDIDRVLMLWIAVLNRSVTIDTDTSVCPRNIKTEFAEMFINMPNGRFAYMAMFGNDNTEHGWHIKGVRNRNSILVAQYSMYPETHMLTDVFIDANAEMLMSDLSVISAESWVPIGNESIIYSHRTQQRTVNHHDDRCHAVERQRRLVRQS
jgi:hypothetical protein